MWAVSLIRDAAGPCFCENCPLVNGGSLLIFPGCKCSRPADWAVRCIGIFWDCAMPVEWCSPLLCMAVLW